MMSPKNKFFASQISAPTRTKRRIILVACVMLGCASGCGEDAPVAAPTPYEFDVEVAVTDENQLPVAKAPVVLDGSVVGYTDRDGIYRATLTEFVGTEVALTIGDMEAYVIPQAAQATTTLERIKTIDGFSNSPVRLNTIVESIRNDYLVWVDLNCADEVAPEHCQNLPVKLNGEAIAKTDAQGRAHFDFQGIPEQTIMLTIDTPTYIPSEGDTVDDVFALNPANPSFKIELGLASEVLTIKETFTDPKAAERLDAKRSRQKAAARYRAAKNRKAAKKKAAKKAKKDGVIDLW